LEEEITPGAFARILYLHLMPVLCCSLKPKLIFGNGHVAPSPPAPAGSEKPWFWVELPWFCLERRFSAALKTLFSMAVSTPGNGGEFF
jgi:hypothetical protein